MSADQKFKIDIGEKFPHLPGAPIVEAIIEIRTRAEGAWDETTMRSYFEPILSGYNYLDAQRIVEHQVQIQAGQVSKQLVRDLGAHLESGSGRCHFGRRRARSTPDNGETHGSVLTNRRE